MKTDLLKDLRLKRNDLQMLVLITVVLSVGINIIDASILSKNRNTAALITAAVVSAIALVWIVRLLVNSAAESIVFRFPAVIFYYPSRKTICWPLGPNGIFPLDTLACAPWFPSTREAWDHVKGHPELFDQRIFEESFDGAGKKCWVPRLRVMECVAQFGLLSVLSEHFRDGWNVKRFKTLSLARGSIIYEKKNRVITFDDFPPEIRDENPLLGAGELRESIRFQMPPDGRIEPLYIGKSTSEDSRVTYGLRLDTKYVVIDIFSLSPGCGPEGPKSDAFRYVFDIGIEVRIKRRYIFDPARTKNKEPYITWADHLTEVLTQFVGCLPY